jgi:single-stranded-DNA-specific exonuclease
MGFHRRWWRTRGTEAGLLVTVDHGIACHAGIAAARQGWKVGDQPPPSGRLAAVGRCHRRPKMPWWLSQQGPAGVGVMFQCCWPCSICEQAASLAEAGPVRLLDLVRWHVGMVPLDANNRAW